MTSVGSKIIRGFIIGTVVLLVVAAAIWLIPGPDQEDEEPSKDGSSGVAVLASDGGTGQPVETAEPPATEPADAAEPTGDRTDPEQVARAFVAAYPGEITDRADPTFLASLDGVDAPLLDQVTDMSLKQADHAFGDIYERYAFTVSGTYQGEEMLVYTIVVARPTEPGEGGSSTKNDLPFQVHSFDWASDLPGDGNLPGPAIGELAPITAEQRGDLISQTRTDVITPVLTVDPKESPEQRQARLDALTVEPTEVTPPMSLSGRYAMTTEILSQAYSTEPGGPITITYTGTWVDHYDPSYNGSWSLTATLTRDDLGSFFVLSVEETAAIDSGAQYE